MSFQIPEGCVDGQNYEARFIKKFSKRVNLPNFKMLQGKFHPHRRDLILVLSSNFTNSSIRMNYVASEKTVMELAQAQKINIPEFKKKARRNTNQHFRAMSLQANRSGYIQTRPALDPDHIQVRQKSAASSVGDMSEDDFMGGEEEKSQEDLLGDDGTQETDQEGAKNEGEDEFTFEPQSTEGIHRRTAVQQEMIDKYSKIYQQLENIQGFDNQATLEDEQGGDDSDEVSIEDRRNLKYEDHKVDNYVDMSEYVDYQPPLVTHHYQLSLWKITCYGAVKLQDRYFNFDTLTYSDQNNISLHIAKDGESVIIAHNGKNMTGELTIKKFNTFPFEEIGQEFTVNSIVEGEGEDAQNADSNDYYSHKTSNQMSEYALDETNQMEKFPEIIIVDDGEYLVYKCYAEYGQRVEAIGFRTFNVNTKKVENYVSTSDSFWNNPILDVQLAEDKVTLYAMINNQEENQIEVHKHHVLKNKSSRYATYDASGSFGRIADDYSTVWFSNDQFDEETDVTMVTLVSCALSSGSHSSDSLHILVKDFTHEPIKSGVFEDRLMIAFEEEFRQNPIIGVYSASETLQKQNEFSSSFNKVDDFTFSSQDKLLVSHSGSTKKIIIKVYDETDSWYLKIKELLKIKFYYPYIFIIKGSNEIIFYKTLNSQFYYIRLTHPIICYCRSTLRLGQHPELKVMVAYKNYFRFKSFIFGVESTSLDVQVETMHRRILQANLPKKRIRSVYGLEKLFEKKGKEPSTCILIHFQSSVITYDMWNPNKYYRFPKKYKKNELMHIPLLGFFCFEYGGKMVNYFPSPVDMSNETNQKPIFVSKDQLNHVSIITMSETNQYLFYVVDEQRYLKEYTIKQEVKDVDEKYGQTKLYLADKEEYFVNLAFQDAVKHFIVFQGALYQGLDGYILQKRGEEIEASAQKIEPDQSNLDQNTQENYLAKQPLISGSWLLFTATEQDNADSFIGFMIAPYNLPTVQNIPHPQMSYTKAEYFFYGDNNYIIYLMQDPQISNIYFYIYQANFQHETTLELKVENIANSSEVDILFSPDGRYLFYVEQISENKTKGTIKEIIKEVETGEFKIQLVNKFDKFHESYFIETVQEYTDCKKFLNNSGQLMMINYDDSKFIYNQVAEPIESKDYFDVSAHQIDWYFAPLGFIGVYKCEIFYIKCIMDEETGQGIIRPKKRLGFDIEGEDMECTGIYPCPSASRICVALGWMKKNTLMKSYADLSLKAEDKVMENSRYEDLHQIVVWDVEKNEEVMNLSFESKQYQYIQGKSSQNGYILTDDLYINLDDGLINYFFEVTFKPPRNDRANFGFRMSEEEDLILEDGSILMKETLMEVQSLDELVAGTEILKKNNISLERIRFQVDGTTAIHLYCLDYEKLELILQYLEEMRPAYLTGILIRNKQGFRPLDITISQESPKNTGLLLEKLHYFQDSAMSKLFQDLFPKLLQMNIPQFLNYLEDCTFTTIQMRKIKYLKVKNKNLPALLSNKSCMIDRNFKDTHCKSRDAFYVMVDVASLATHEDESDVLEDFQSAKEAKFDKDRPEKNDTAMSLTEMYNNSDYEQLDTNASTAVVETSQPSDAQKDQRLDIRAIEFDWIFNDSTGKDFLFKLSESDNLELFSVTLIQQLVTYLWGYFRNGIILRILIPYIFNFILIVIYTTYINKAASEESVKYDGKNRWKYWYTVNFCFNIINLIITLYFSIIELTQLWFHKLNYFTQFWNILDSSALILTYILIITDLAEIKQDKFFVSMATILVFIMWMKQFYFLRLFPTTALLVRMIIDITMEIKWFLMVMLLAILGFGNSFFIISKNLKDEELLGFFVGPNFMTAFLYSYKNSLGDFNFKGYEYRDVIMVHLLWFFHTWLTLIILLNLLIAIMGDTYARVKENEQNNMLKEFCEMITENEMLFKRSRLFKDKKYIFVVEKEKFEKEDDSFEGKLQSLKKEINSTQGEKYLQKIILQIKKQFQRDVKQKCEEKFKSVDIKLTKHLDHLSDKLDIMEKLQNGEYLDPKELQMLAEQTQDTENF